MGFQPLETICWKAAKVIDAHVHFRYKEPVPHFKEILRMTGTDKINILAGPGDELPRKKEDPQTTYTFRMPKQDPEKIKAHDGSDLVQEIDRILADGCDGIKMMDGKPAMRRTWQPLRVDDVYFAGYWEKLAAMQVPVTIHVSDPVAMWRPEAPDRYCELEPQEEFFRQMIHVLERNPKLQVNIAHFFFMGPQMERLGELFATYSNLHVDLALGPEFLFYCAEDPGKARDFFVRWSERILYGTDISDVNSLKLAWAKAETLRRFLETDEIFPLLTSLAMGQPPAIVNGRFELQGIQLPQEALENICWRNFERFATPAPKPLGNTAPAATKG